MAGRYTPHHHADNLGSPWRRGEIVICPGCDRVVKTVAAYGDAWWRDMLWPWSARWRRRLEREDT